MNCLQENDACPYCWHQTVKDGPEGSIGNYSIYPMITHKGGSLDNHGTCNVCMWNFILVINCKNCQKNQPCYQHYASAYDGVFDKHVSSIMHDLYMRNSPYNRSWERRPSSIGQWYAEKVTNYMEAIMTLKRFTSDYKVLSDLNDLEKNTKNNINVFWHDLKVLCLRHFSCEGAIPDAVNTFCYVLWNNHQLHNLNPQTNH